MTDNSLVKDLSGSFLSNFMEIMILALMHIFLVIYFGGSGPGQHDGYGDWTVSATMCTDISVF